MVVHNLHAMPSSVPCPVQKDTLNCLKTHRLVLG
uniref:Uncharacterized protein n=1 Tax=Anguilla anguilla TaxID=7936 RepID=A0A0E9S0J1_ANGAN